MFKVNDRVKIKKVNPEDSNANINKGDLGTIVEIRKIHKSLCYYVNLDKFTYKALYLIFFKEQLEYESNLFIRLFKRF